MTENDVRYGRRPDIDRRPTISSIRPKGDFRLIAVLRNPATLERFRGSGTPEGLSLAASQYRRNFSKISGNDQDMKHRPGV
jgi:hypothetical protein